MFEVPARVFERARCFAFNTALGWLLNLIPLALYKLLASERFRAVKFVVARQKMLPERSFLIAAAFQRIFMLRRWLAQCQLLLTLSASFFISQIVKLFWFTQGLLGSPQGRPKSALELLLSAFASSSFVLWLLGYVRALLLSVREPSISIGAFKLKP